MLYKGERTRELIFPIGGIGTGSIGFAGNGRFVDWEIFNRPNKGSDNGYSHLALRCSGTKGVKCKVLNGDLLGDYMGHYKGDVPYSGYGYGPSGTTMAGFDHFREWAFDGTFPIGKLLLSDPDFPAKAEIAVWSPMIPNDSEASSFPGGFFDVTVENTDADEQTVTAAFSLANPFSVSRNVPLPDGSGVYLKNAGDKEDMPEYGDLCLTASGGEVMTVADWYRGGWQDPVATYWREFTSPEGLHPREYETDGSKDTCTVAVTALLQPGEKKTFRFLMTWNVPNCRNYWFPVGSNPGESSNEGKTEWRNWYAVRWHDSRDSNRWGSERREKLCAGTLAFRDALWNTTVPPEVIDAAADSLSVLHSPTVLRLEDGTFWGWEGVMEQQGSCEGSCTHVWNYAYALCYLFPDLERGMRETDFRENLQPDGAMRFRLPLPLGRGGGWAMPCADGQMGGIIKTYRDWKLCGDRAWLEKLWPAVKKTLSFAWSEANPLGWDRDKDGIMEGRQHHTLDMELFGPSAWLEGMYLAALKAAAEMARALGDTDFAVECEELFRKGSAGMERELFNGSWYVQNVDLGDKDKLLKYGNAYSTLRRITVEQAYWNEETNEIKYQIGEGCEIDQTLGQWHADLCGLGDVFDPAHRRTALESLYRWNFKPTFRGFTNPWRNFVLNDEAGAIICSYPDGAKKPSIPIPYCEETMHGFEYQLAGQMLHEGMTEEGLSIVRGVRNRYDGAKRNPYNEIECGNNYSRSMAAFGLLPILGGFLADLPEKKLRFVPVGEPERFKTIWSVDGAWGTAEFTPEGFTLKILEGELRANSFELPFTADAANAVLNGESVRAFAADRSVRIDRDSLTGTLFLPKA